MIEATGAYAPVEAVAAFIASHGVDRRLLRHHRMRLLLGLGATVLVVFYNLLHTHATNAMDLRLATARMLVGIHLACCLVALLACTWRLNRQLHAQPGSLRDQVWRVASFSHRWGNLLLFLSATGHGVLILGTLLGLNLAAPDGSILILTLVPTMLVVIHGLFEAPTAARLVRIHRGLVDHAPLSST